MCIYLDFYLCCCCKKKKKNAEIEMGGRKEISQKNIVFASKNHPFLFFSSFYLFLPHHTILSRLYIPSLKGYAQEETSRKKRRKRKGKRRKDAKSYSTIKKQHDGERK